MIIEKKVNCKPKFIDYLKISIAEGLFKSQYCLKVLKTNSNFDILSKHSNHSVVHPMAP